MTVLQLQPSRNSAFSASSTFSASSASSVSFATLSGETYIIMCLLMENFTIAIALIAVSGISMGSWCVL